LKTISKEFIEKEVLPVVLNRGRKHDYFLIKQILEEASYEEEILFCLEDYQNEDGGFGHGLEADIRLEDSSVAATDIAAAVLEDVDYNEVFVQKIVDYYLRAYDEERKGWRIVPNNVDDAPHAIWWNNDKIDESFGYINPNAEVIGFLKKHEDLVEGLNVDDLIEYMIIFLKSKPEAVSMHDLNSLMVMYDNMTSDIKAELKPLMEPYIKKEIVTDQTKWKDYVCMPLDMVKSPDSDFLVGYEQLVEDNLDFYVDYILENKVFEPAWQWYQHDEVFEEIKDEWMGFITYNKLKVLFLFGRIV
jgi:hypothetical protein